MSPRVILYVGLVVALFPIWGMSQYMMAFLSVDDIGLRRQFLEQMAMIGMFSWPIWLGLVGYTVLKWRYYKIFERFLAWCPMIVFIVCYSTVLTR